MPSESRDHGDPADHDPGSSPTEPEPSSESGAGPGSGAETWSPNGLELARSVAGALAAAGGRNRPRPRRMLRRTAGTVRPTGSGPDDRDPQPLEAAMDRMVADRGWRTDIAVAGALARWPEIVGAEIAAHCTAEHFSQGVLTVRADSTAWATQVRMLAPTLLQRLNEDLGDGTVIRVDVKGPTTPSWRKGPRSVRDGLGPRDTYG